MPGKKCLGRWHNLCGGRGAQAQAFFGSLPGGCCKSQHNRLDLVELRGGCCKSHAHTWAWAHLGLGLGLEKSLRRDTKGTYKGNQEQNSM